MGELGLDSLAQGQLLGSFEYDNPWFPLNEGVFFE